MKRISCLLTLCLPFIVLAQTSSSAMVEDDVEGIKWTKGLNWEQVKQKAKTENKYIFIDAFTTWCGPCKAMDKMVFANDTVVKYVNENFIAVKVQMDQTKKDNDLVKAWYKDAESIKNQYRVEAFPSFIFLAPSGEIVHMDKGLKKVPEFVELAKTALTPGKKYEDPYAEYEQLIGQYKQGVIQYERLPYMITYALKTRDMEMTHKLIKEHAKYAATLPKEKRYTEENINVWSKFAHSTKTKIFQFFYKDGELIDKVMGKKRYAENEVDKSIRAEFVAAFYNEQNKDSKVALSGMIEMDDGRLQASYADADWKKLEKTIRKNVNSYYAKKNVLYAQIEWYKRHRNYNKAYKIALGFLDKYESIESRAWTVNNFAFDAFKLCTDKHVIDGYIVLAQNTMRKHKVNSLFLDTYANLLYKAGRTQEAIEWELKAADQCIIDGQAYRKDAYMKVVENMKRGAPTWGAIWGYK